MSEQEYTPSTEEVRLAYTTAGSPDADFGDIVGEFDRWLLAERARIWDEGHDSGFDDARLGRGVLGTPNPYRKGGDA